MLLIKSHLRSLSSFVSLGINEPPSPRWHRQQSSIHSARDDSETFVCSCFSEWQMVQFEMFFVPLCAGVVWANTVEDISLCETLYWLTVLAGLPCCVAFAKLALIFREITIDFSGSALQWTAIEEPTRSHFPSVTYQCSRSVMLIGA